MKRCCVALLLGLVAGVAAAAPIYRCGQTYSQTPCPGGRVIDASDPRSAAQRAEARRVAEREKKAAVQARAASAAASAGEAASTPAQDRRKDAKPAQAASAPGLIFITPRPGKKPASAAS